MYQNNENQKNKNNIEIFKWGIVFILLIIAIIGNYYFRKYNLIIRFFVIISLILLSGIIALWTKKGKKILEFTKESFIEIKKVIWPTKQETLQITLVVAIVTTIMSLILWGLDSILVRFISFITNIKLF
ncbi:preprotein translocase subunit SecE [Candidatus Providencia siddallii]|uniref:Protein translocase subunit SecE n=1 Tax=Candidatus Providencia siddallii TaxID=1715285 RepID=A0ABP1CDG3_9GAMM